MPTRNHLIKEIGQYVIPAKAGAEIHNSVTSSAVERSILFPQPSLQLHNQFIWHLPLLLLVPFDIIIACPEPNVVQRSCLRKQVSSFCRILDCGYVVNCHIAKRTLNPISIIYPESCRERMIERKIR